MKLHVNDLILETTRRCNMSCAHCMRGDVQPVDMNGNVLENLFSRIGSITTLTFSGGEPSLVPDVMRDARFMARKYHVPVEQVYLATNGKEVSDRFLTDCFEWHKYCIFSTLPETDDNHVLTLDQARTIWQRSASEGNYGDERIGLTIALSLDAYHEPITMKNLCRLMTLPYHDASKSEPLPQQYLLRTGRAKDMKQARTDSWNYADTARHISLEPYDDGTVSTEQIYVSIDGHISYGCNYSYEDQPKWSALQITGRDWLDELIRMQQKHDVNTD